MQESVRGTGKLTLFPTDKTFDIAIASPPAENLEKTLNLSSNELTTFGRNFSKIIIGRESTSNIGQTDLGISGSVYIGSKAENQITFFNSVEIYGKNISIKDYSNPNLKFQTQNNLKLNALVDITIANEMKAGDGKDNAFIVLQAQTGKIKQENDSNDNLANEEIIAQNVNLNAQTGIDLQALNTLSVNAVNVNLQTLNGTGNIQIHITSPENTTTIFSSVQNTPLGNLKFSSEKNNLTFNSVTSHYPQVAAAFLMKTDSG